MPVTNVPVAAVPGIAVGDPAQSAGRTPTVPSGRYSRAMSSARERVLDAAGELVAAGDAVPSLDAVAAAAGVSKGGLLYHFPDKRALLHGILGRAVTEADNAFTAAAAAGRLAETWLRLSVPSAGGRGPLRAMLAMLRITSTGDVDLPPEVLTAGERWQQLLDREIGDPARARMVRLVGDGLLLNALTGQAAPPGAVEEIVRQLLTGSRS